MMYGGQKVQKIAREVIRDYDHNQDGILDRMETRNMLEDALRSLGTPVINDPLLDRLVEALDIEQDGIYTESNILPVLIKILQKLLNPQTNSPAPSY